MPRPPAPPAPPALTSPGRPGGFLRSPCTALASGSAREPPAPISTAALPSAPTPPRPAGPPSPQRRAILRCPRPAGTTGLRRIGRRPPAPPLPPLPSSRPPDPPLPPEPCGVAAAPPLPPLPNQRTTAFTAVVAVAAAPDQPAIASSARACPGTSRSPARSHCRSARHRWGFPQCRPRRRITRRGRDRVGRNRTGSRASGNGCRWVQATATVAAVDCAAPTADAGVLPPPQSTPPPTPAAHPGTIRTKPHQPLQLQTPLPPPEPSPVRLGPSRQQGEVDECWGRRRQLGQGPSLVGREASGDLGRHTNGRKYRFGRGAGPAHRIPPGRSRW